MKRRSKMVVKASRILTDADPRFVSQVRNGANQMPARIVKTDETPETVPVAGHKQETATMGKKTEAKPTVRKRVRTEAAKVAAPAVPEAKPEIQSIFFPLEHYQTEEAVKAYLNDHGYDVETPIVKDGVGWIAKGHEEDEFEGDFHEIEHEAGKVTLIVGYLKPVDEAAKAAKEAADKEAADKAAAETPASEAAASTETPAAPAADTPVQTEAEKAAASAAADPGDEEDEEGEIDGAEAVLRFDTAMAEAKLSVYSIGKMEDPQDTTRKVASISEVLRLYDDVPPGFYDLMNAYGYVVRSAVRDGELNNIRKASRELGEFLIQLADLFKPQDAQQNSADAAPATSAEKAAKLADVVALALGAGKAKPVAAKTAAGAETPADPALAAILAIATKLDTMGERLDRIEVAGTAAVEAPAAEAARAPTRKAEDGGNDTAGQEPEKKVVSKRYLDNVPKDRLFRGTLGLPAA